MYLIVIHGSGEGDQQIVSPPLTDVEAQDQKRQFDEVMSNEEGSGVVMLPWATFRRERVISYRIAAELPPTGTATDKADHAP